MNLLQGPMANFGKEIVGLLSLSSNLGIALVDDKLSIVDCNDGFRKLFVSAQSLHGRPLADFLELADHNLSGSEELRLSCSQKSGLDGIFHCRCIAVDSGHLLFCERLVLTESHALESMGAMTNELINLQRDLVKKSRLLEETKQELAVALAHQTSQVKQLTIEQHILLDTMPIGACFLKVGWVRLANPAFDKILGYEIGETLLMPASKFLTGAGAPNSDVQLVKKDGSLVWCSTVEQTVNQDGLVEGTIWIIQDITERKQAEEEQARLEAQLQQAQKIESVGRLAGGVAHDFNNMLGVILGHTELAFSQIDPTEPVFENLTEIHQAASRSADLTRQLLTFARKQAITPKALNLNESIDSTLKMLQRLIGEDITLTWLPGSDLWSVKMDPAQIDQILINLCINARDAITRIGNISIRTGNITIEADQGCVPPGLNPGQYVQLAICDNGSGIDEETQFHIFEPFFTTKEIGQGTGLGLATVHGVVKQNNGFIHLQSVPDLETTFTIYLPRYEGDDLSSMKEESTKPTGGGQETILLVEDEVALLEMTRKMLELWGYTVLTAETPEVAIRLAHEHAGKIHLLLSDVVMPEMTGLELAEILLADRPHLKHLYISGYSASIIFPNGMLDDGSHFLQKPFTLEGLVAKVSEALL